MLIQIFALLLTIQISIGWNLASLGIQTDNTNSSTVHHISVYYARAFLCLKHSKNHIRPQPTLVEASWPENMIGVKPIIFPSEDYFIRRAGKCKGIKQAAVSFLENRKFCNIKVKSHENSVPILFPQNVIIFII